MEEIMAAMPLTISGEAKPASLPAPRARSGKVENDMPAYRNQRGEVLVSGRMRCPIPEVLDDNNDARAGLAIDCSPAIASSISRNRALARHRLVRRIHSRRPGHDAGTWKHHSQLESSLRSSALQGESIYANCRIRPTGSTRKDGDAAELANDMALELLPAARDRT